MNVLIIPEDFRTDQYILKPIVEKMLAVVGKPNAKVRVCLDPLLGGISEALKWERIQEVLTMYSGMVQLFLLIVDRDGIATRRASLDTLEAKAGTVLPSDAVLFGELAWQEIEVWALAGVASLPKPWKWNDVRQEPHPKERYFEPYAESMGLMDEPGSGRTTLGRNAAHNYARLRSRCREDIQNLEERIKVWLI